MPSSLNRSGGPIYAGMAITISNDRANPTSAPSIATALAADGAPDPGVVITITSGVLELDNWSLITGSQFLQVGAVYYVGSRGQLIANGSGQAIGQAISPTQLEVHISARVAPPPAAVVTVDVDPREPLIIAAIGTPWNGIGLPGDFFVSTTVGQMWGPKTGDNTWEATPILS